MHQEKPNAGGPHTLMCEICVVVNHYFSCYTGEKRELICTWDSLLTHFYKVSHRVGVSGLLTLANSLPLVPPKPQDECCRVASALAMTGMPY